MKRILLSLLTLSTLQTTLPMQESEKTEADPQEKVVHHHHYNVKFRGIASLVATGSILLLGWRYGRPTYAHVKPFIKMPKTLEALQASCSKEFKFIRDKLQTLTSDSYKMNMKLSQITNNMATKNDVQRVEKLVQQVIVKLDEQTSFTELV